MLPNLHRLRYQEFKQALEQLQQATAVNQQNPSTLRQNFLEAQQFFQQIVNLDDKDLEAVDEPKVRSYQTEMSKQLQMLGMDIMFLQAARQPGTTQERHTQLKQRLQTLISYCDAVLQ